MSLTLTTATGTVFARLGKMIKAIRHINGFRGEVLAVGDTNDTGAVWGNGGPTVIDAKTMFDAVHDQFLSTNQSLLDNLYSQQTGYRTAQSGMISYWKTLAQNTLITMVNDDAVLVTKDLATAMKELIRQMVAGNKTVTKNVVSVSVTADGGNTGDAAVAASVIGKDGKPLEYVFTENMEVQATSDAGLGATAGTEPMSIRGESSVADPMDWNWPKGSSCSGSTNVLNASGFQGTNVLNKSDFDYFTVNVPDKWEILVGSAGTSIKKNVANAHRSGTVSSLEYVGDSAELTSIAQTFGSSSYTTSTLKPNTVYAVNYFVKVSATPAAGVLDVDLINATGPAIINNDAGTPLTVTKNLTGVSTSWVAVSGFFQTPKVLPTTYRLRVRLSTALETGKSVYIDDLSMREAVQAYTGGPYIAVFRGATDVIKGDLWTVGVANTWAGVFQSYFDRMFGMRTTLGLQLPSDVSGNIADTATF